MYEGAHARPDGGSTVARLASTAADYGFEGVVVRNHDDDRTDYDAERVREASGVDVVDGLEVRADGPEAASGAVGNYRREVTLLLMQGGTPELNRFAVEQPRVDVLARPMAGSGDFNHVLAKAARENGVRVEFDFSSVLTLTGGPRVQALSDLRKLREVVDTYDAPYVVSANPFSHLQLRAPRELVAVGELVGFPSERLAEGLREWHRLAERNRERQSEEFIEPGVQRGTYEEEP
jgi:ribonuclease P/MRP protein subunit RPP1